ncbi:YdcF family protein [Sporosarcina sp. G11-34]|uniref:YdcF family protein n=1 Tax=Sporosarcina sp. G11-34 TaxID=2849605 RepID=UPI0022A8F521|nr:YdcF family protein [Sporosarcina sp. G11-34]MCZ2260849.1 YdcF family protein [Sporosarcina sp. G11-34]
MAPVIFLWILTGKWIANGQKPIADGTNDYAIILGAKVNGEIASLSLRYRLDAALDYANQYPHVRLILSGGQGVGEHISEGEAMKKYLMEKGIDEHRLLVESASTSTYENILYSKELMPPTVESVTIITSDYHLERSKRIAQSLDLQTDVVAAKTPKVVEQKLRLRERLALIKTAIIGK